MASMPKQPIVKTEASKEEIKWIAAFLKEHKIDLTTVEEWNLNHTYRELRPWDRDDYPRIEDGKLRWTLEHLKKKAVEDYEKKSRQYPPRTIWVIGLSMHNAVGSITHVTHHDPYFFTEEECQKHIDTMPSWLGMGDRSRYRPVPFIFKKGD